MTESTVFLGIHRREREVMDKSAVAFPHFFKNKDFLRGGGALDQPKRQQPTEEVLFVVGRVRLEGSGLEL